MDFRRVFGRGRETDVDFGPTLMLNLNRCILCAVRPLHAEIDGDAQIGIVDAATAADRDIPRGRRIRPPGTSGRLPGQRHHDARASSNRPWDNPRRDTNLHSARRLQHERGSAKPGGRGDHVSFG
jgi:hypothetical protein